MERSNQSQILAFGSSMPSFSLPATTGIFVDKTFFADSVASLVVFSCNHCPYVKGSEPELIALVRELAPAGLRCVAISSNDATTYPDDSFELMKVKAKEMDLPYPYLYDESQSVAKAFDAACTPECYLFDSGKRLAFHGPINDSPRDPKLAQRHYLADAVRRVISGQLIEVPFVHPIGCSIKWRPGS